MPIVRVNGINLSYEEYGAGEPVLLIPGTGARGRVWRTHQVPALVAAGYRAITIDNRGVPPSDVCEEGFTLGDMIADTVGLIEFLGLGACNIVGSSMGSVLVQELLVVHPRLAKRAVLMAPRGRMDPLSKAMSAGESKMLDDGIKLPPKFDAYFHVLRGFSPHTLNNEEAVQDWLDIFELAAMGATLSRSQLELDVINDRLKSYRSIQCPYLILAFSNDLIVPPYLSREVADSIPNSTYEEIAECGHFGYLEQPDAVNAALIKFFQCVPA